MMKENENGESINQKYHKFNGIGSCCFLWRFKIIGKTLYLGYMQ